MRGAGPLRATGGPGSRKRVGWVGRWEMETLQMSFPWSGERELGIQGGDVYNGRGSVRERPIVGEDGSGTGRNREGGKAGGE